MVLSFLSKSAKTIAKLSPFSETNLVQCAVAVILDATLHCT